MRIPLTRSSLHALAPPGSVPRRSERLARTAEGSSPSRTVRLIVIATAIVAIAVAILSAS
jgi:hypothetical protein